MKIKLFCLPYAGASSNVYLKWKNLLDPRIELYQVEYPGRGKRFSSPLCNTMETLIEDLYIQVAPAIRNTPYSLFGHSLGSVTAFALTLKLLERGIKSPVHLFFSGHNAPYYEKDRKIAYTLPDEELIAEIVSYGGTPEEIFKTIEIKELFLPIIRADMQIAETYYPAYPQNKFKMDIDVLYGKSDAIISKQGVDAWELCTAGSSTITAFDGDHMYLTKKEKETVDVINRVLSRYL